MSRGTRGAEQRANMNPPPPPAPPNPAELMQNDGGKSEDAH